MRRLLILLLLLTPCIAAAQSSTTKEFFDRYAKADGFTSVVLEQRMMQMMSQQAKERGDQSLGVLLGDIEYIRIVALKGGDGSEFIRNAEAMVGSDRKFKLITSGSEDGQTTKFYIRQPTLSMNSELVMITYGPKESVVVNIYGEFDLKQVARLSSIRPK